MSERNSTCSSASSDSIFNGPPEVEDHGVVPLGLLLSQAEHLQIAAGSAVLRSPLLGRFRCPAGAVDASAASRHDSDGSSVAEERARSSTVGGVFQSDRRTSSGGTYPESAIEVGVRR